MGDRSNFSMVIWHLDPAKRDEIFAAIEYELGTPDGDCDSAADLVGNWLYCGEQSTGLIVDGFPQRLINIDPTIMFQMHSEARYEFLGDCAWYAPEPGLYTHDCDQDGNPVVGYEELWATGILLSPESDGHTVQGLLDAQHKLALAYGRYQSEAFPDADTGVDDDSFQPPTAEDGEHHGSSTQPQALPGPG